MLSVGWLLLLLVGEHPPHYYYPLNWAQFPARESLSHLIYSARQRQSVAKQEVARGREREGT